MEEFLEMKDFDILGLITLRDVKGIEKYVTPVNLGNQSMFQEYLSRSKEYYNVKLMTELSQQREELKELIDARPSKRNFVILENMLNCSGRVYFRKMEQFIKNRTIQNEDEMNLAKQCMDEDTRNLITILSKKGLIRVTRSLKLPGGNENSEKRLIEMDNKAMLYIFCKSLGENLDIRNTEVLTPGYGSIYIGPFLYQMYGCSYTNLLKSKYIKETLPQTQETELMDLVSSDRIFKKEQRILLLDDNIGTGQTMDEIKKQLELEGVTDIISGAVQYNWINYYRISTGEKTTDKNGNKIKRFNAKNYDIVSPINYYGHKLCEDAVDMLHSSGEEYVRYLTSKSYRLPGYNDLIGAIERGIQYASMAGLNLTDKYKCSIRKSREKKTLLDEYKSEDDWINNSGQESINTILKNIKNLTYDKDIIIEKE